MRLLDGKQMAEEKMAELKTQAEALKSRGIVPGLAVVLAGNDPASQVYVRNKEKACQALGIRSETHRLPETVSQAEAEALVARLNADPAVDGILVQLPLPEGLDESKLLQLIEPKKDVDGFHPVNVGALASGQQGMIPCTPKGIMHMLKAAGVPLAGKEAVVIGRSNIVGKPTALLLLRENCTVTICHSKTENLREHTRRADILVAAVGKPRFVTADMVKPGAAVIDVGINRTEAELVGDVDFENVAQVAGYLSPVPGGVGKMTVCMLMENTLLAARERSR